MKVPYAKPDITQAEINEVVDTLQSGFILSGKKAKRLAEGIASFCEAPHAVCVGSFSEGMEKILSLLDIGPGDEVILSAYTHPAAANAVCRAGARPILADTAPDSYTVSPERLLAAVTSSTKAIILSDIGGVMCDYDQARCVLHSKRHIYQPRSETQAAINRVTIIGDASHSFGSRHDIHKSGQGADFSCFSFQTPGILFAGDGAAIAWRELPGFPHEKLSGLSASSDAFHDDFQSGLTDFVAGLLLAQLGRAGAIHERQHEIIRQYDEALRDLSWPLRHRGKNFVGSGSVYMLRVPGMREAERDAMMRDLLSVGIETRVHYRPLPMWPVYQKLGYSISSFPNAYRQYENEMSLPIHASMTDKAVAFVSDSIRRAMVRAGLATRARSRVFVESV